MAGFPPFQVECTSNALAQFRLLAQRATYQGRGWELAAAMRRAQDRLRAAAHEIGEPLYRLRHMKMMVLRLIVPPMYIEYGIHDDQPVVIIRRVAGLTEPGE